MAWQVGEIVGHSTRVVYVSQYYGGPLEYHGELSGWFWPRSMKDTDRALGNAPAVAGRSVAERLADLGTAQARAAPDFVPEYFVITDFREDAHHDDLAEYLDAHCRKLAEDAAYLVFGECAGAPG